MLSPDRIALAFEEEEYSAARLEALAGGLAGTLARRGVRAGDRVALMASNRPEWIVAVQAIWRLGAAVVLFSPAWKQAEAEHALAITEPAHAVGDHPVLAGLMPMLPLDEPITPGQGPSGPWDEPDPAADAVLVFSSGTTGLPKAVRHTHASLRAAVRHWQDALGLTARDRIQVTTPPSHILGLLNIVTALETGTWMRLHRRFDLDRMLEHIEADRITVEMAVAPIALALASHPKLESYDLSSLRYIMWGATPVTPSVAEIVTRRTGDVGTIDADGWLRLTDRSKEMIKVRGFQVAPAEVEAILHGHPAVADCAVFGIPDPANGEAVIAAVTPDGTGDPVDPAELIALVGDKLASYKRPSRVVLIDEIPRLPSGKVLRRVLREKYGRPSDH